MGLTREEQNRLGLEVGRVFSPAAPIDERALFAGRTDQLRDVIDAVNQRGQHAMIFGERGVGKTSLANVLSDFLQAAGEEILAPHVNCDGTDDFSKLWRKILSEIEIASQVRRMGFTANTSAEFKNVADSLPKNITPDIVRRTLSALGSQTLLIVIIDEFDRLPNGNVGRLFADAIKMLSDHSVPATLVLVGVADSVDELIEEHESVERALVQVRMPRMSPGELREIIENGLSRVEMTIEKDALNYISMLSQGLPHYTHLLGLYSAREAIDLGELRIALSHVKAAITKAITKAQQTIMSAYHKATMSPRKENLFTQVLLACALADSDDLGYFAAADVRGPMSLIMGRSYDIPTFSRHLNDFCEETRGPVLQKTGYKHRFRFRFVNPLMQPFAIMQGLASGMIDRPTLQRLQ